MNMLNILIIEDDLITATDIQETLEMAGHQITAIARNFNEAMAAVKRQLPDLALVDVRLEGSSKDGIATVQELLTLHWMPIYLTSSSEKETFQRAKLTQPAAFLLKPFRSQELAMQVELAYNNRKLTPTSAEATYFYLPVKKGYEKIILADVLYLLADGAYTKAFLFQQEAPLLISMNLGHLEQYFVADYFYKVSRSLMINLTHLARVESSQIWMQDHASPVFISSANHTELMKRLKVIRKQPKTD